LTFGNYGHNMIIEGDFLRSRLVKMLFVYEVQAVMECGEHGDSQRWQLTINHLAKAKRKLFYRV